MLRWAIIFLIISVIAGAFGFFNLSDLSRRISLILFALFFIGFLVLLAFALLVVDAVSAPFVAPPTLLALAGAGTCAWRRGSLPGGAAREMAMPARSKKQQMAAGAALAAKRGKRSKGSLRGASRGMYSSMSESELRRMAKTKRKGKPTRVRKSRNGRRRRRAR